MFCPKCATPMNVSDNPMTALSWCVCPKDGYCTHSITAFLKNYNLTTEDAIKMLKEGKKFPFQVTEEDLQFAEIEQYCRRKVGGIAGWGLDQYFKYGKEMDDGSVTPYREPPMICICNTFLETTKPFTKCVSTKELKLGNPLGLNIPIFQEQCQYVGQCSLYKDTQEGFAWKTYLLDHYADRPRGFLSYRPQKVRDTHEIVLVDNFSAYLQMLYWYDTARQEPNATFPDKVVPVLALGKPEVALKYLFDYFWSPARITLASPRTDTLNALWELVTEPTRLKCDSIRVMNSPAQTAFEFKTCRNRKNFETMLLSKFHSMCMDYNDFELKECA